MYRLFHLQQTTIRDLLRKLNEIESVHDVQQSPESRVATICNMLFTGFTKATVRMLYEVITFNIFLSINNCFYHNKLIIFEVDSAAKHRQALPSVTYFYHRSNVDFI